MRLRLQQSWPAVDQAAAADLGNVIPFARRAAHQGTQDIRPTVLEGAERPAPPRLENNRRFWLAGFIAASLLLHASAFAMFLQSPAAPLPGIGLQTIAVEIVFGVDTLAGVASAPAEQEAQPQPAAEASLEPPMTEPPAPMAEAAVVTPPPERKEVSRQDAKTESRKEKASPPRKAASGVGRGRSSNDPNYSGLVAAHLARHKRFPPGAQNERTQGVAVVNFSLDGNGRVAGVKLVRSSGASVLDQEASAMVRRASPFPPPPSGGTASFTVPLDFQIR